MTIVKTRQEFLQGAKKRLPNKPVCAELGVYRGDFSQLIFDILDPYRLILIDCFSVSDKQYLDGMHISYSSIDDYSFVMQRFAHISEIEVIKSDTSSIEGYNSKMFGLIYHDASHLKEDIKRDLDFSLHTLGDDGLMCGHDYIQHESFGVIQAVDEFCKEHNFEMIILNENGGDYALRAIQ